MNFSKSRFITLCSGDGCLIILRQITQCISKPRGLNTTEQPWVLLAAESFVSFGSGLPWLHPPSRKWNSAL